MLFSGSPEIGNALLPALWNDLQLCSVGFAFQDENESCCLVMIERVVDLYHAMVERDCTDWLRECLGSLKCCPVGFSRSLTTL